VIDRDEYLRPGTTLESLAGLDLALVRPGAEGQDGPALAERAGS
jgi:hypothetical protein